MRVLGEIFGSRLRPKLPENTNKVVVEKAWAFVLHRYPSSRVPKGATRPLGFGESVSEKHTSRPRQRINAKAETRSNDRHFEKRSGSALCGPG
jgi:hypothetical protein